jgi:hypothetical protein
MFNRTAVAYHIEVNAYCILLHLLLQLLHIHTKKVLSGTENGDLLLWEGSFIKCRFIQSNGDTCHTGTYVNLTVL